MFFYFLIRSPQTKKQEKPIGRLKDYYQDFRWWKLYDATYFIGKQEQSFTAA